MQGNGKITVELLSVCDVDRHFDGQGERSHLRLLAFEEEGHFV